MLLSHDEYDCLHDMWIWTVVCVIVFNILGSPCLFVFRVSRDEWQKLPVHRSFCEQQHTSIHTHKHYLFETQQASHVHCLLSPMS